MPGLKQATEKLKAQGLKKGGFPDLSGDGKITKKDVLMGRGGIKRKAGGLAGRLAQRGYGKPRA